jgi:hypothetical protein
MLVLQIAGGVLLALVVYRAFQWAVRKAKERAAEERFIAGVAAEMKLDREGDGDWLRG